MTAPTPTIITAPSGQETNDVSAMIPSPDVAISSRCPAQESAQPPQASISQAEDVLGTRRGIDSFVHAQGNVTNDSDPANPRQASQDNESPDAAAPRTAEHESDANDTLLPPALPGPQLEKPYNTSDPRRKREPTIRLWYLELLACCFSFICFAAIVGVLIFEDGKTLDQWRFLINPTALVSFIGVLGKSSFLLVVTEVISQLKWLHFHAAHCRLRDFQAFDSASRGPLGASQLLWTRRWNSRLASAAALLVLLSLVVDPFVQLVFRFPTRTLPSASEQAGFRTASWYNPNHLLTHESMDVYSPSVVDQPMQSAILRAFLNSPMSQDVTCSSGNCTISNATTLAICSSCINATESISIRCPDHESSTDHDGQHNLCNYTLGGPEVVLQGSTYTATGQFVFWSGFETTNTATSYTRWNSTIYDSTWWVGSLISELTDRLLGDYTDFFHVFAVQMQDSGHPFRDLTSPLAWDCKLAPCEQTFQIEVVDGTVAPSMRIETQWLRLVPRQDNYTYGTEWLMETHPAGNNKTRYLFNSANRANIMRYLSDLLMIGWWNEGTFQSTRLRGNSSGRLDSFGAHDNITPDIGRSLALAADVPKLFEMMASNMTEAIRMRGVLDEDDNIGLHRGLANRTESYIEVRWAYLAFPFALTAMSAVLLAVAIVLTERSDVPAWRSSSLAVLMHGLRGWNMDDQVAGNPKELEGKAKLMRAKLSKDEWPPTFVKAD